MVDCVRASYPRPLLRDPQPPTPPLEPDPDSKKGFSNAIDSPQRLKQFLATPDGSSSPTADYFTKTSDKAVKRVDFSPWIHNIQPVNTHTGGWHSEQRIRRLPPSRDCRSAKSILKPYPIALPSDVRSSPTPDHKPFPEMLEDWCRALASKSRGSRLDAYSTINNCLKVYNDIPHQNALRDKMTLLCDFIRRDLHAELEPGSMDTQMMIQATKLLSVFLWTPVLSAMLPDEFCSFVVERSIAMLENKNTSKAVVNHFLNLLATQNFRRQVMNSEDRAKRILNLLNEIGSRVKGNGVVGQRLIIYKRLLNQAKPLMTSRVTDWVDAFFTGMLSSIKDIRSRALAFGLDAAITLGTVSSVSNAIMETLNRTSSNGGKRFIDVVIDRMNAMIASAEDSSHVPQIWSVVILFFRGHRGQLEAWEHVKSWLGIIQKCFNSSDVQVKSQASQAWNRLIFAMGLDVNTSLSTTVMLRAPILPQLERKGSQMHAKHARQMAYSTYCTLLYYAFRPGATPAHLDKYWSEFIESFFPAHISVGKFETRFACQVLSSLLGESKYKVWDSNRVNEEGFIGPEDLPRLDPKWIRVCAHRILTIFEHLFRSADWQGIDDQDNCILQAWRSFTRALGDAGSKEVKVSMDCMRAVAQILSSMKRLLLQVNNPQKPLTAERLLVLVRAAVNDLGPLVFTEKRVTQGSSELFEAAETPSSRSIRPSGTLASPVAHLIEIVIVSVQPSQPVETYEESLRSLIDIALRGGTSKRLQISILHDLVSLADSKKLRSFKATEVLWRLIIASLELAIGTESCSTGGGNGMMYSADVCKDITAIIETGFRESFTPSPSWEAFLGGVINKIQKEVGTATAAIAILEPLSKALTQATSAKYDISHLQAAKVVIKSVGWPTSRKEVENAQAALHGSSSPSPRPTSANPYHHLFSLTNSLLTAVYRDIRLTDLDTLRNLFQSLICAISSCPLSIAAIVIQKIQHGIGVWIEDPDNLRHSAKDAIAFLDPIILETWTIVAKKMKILPSVDASYSLSIEYLIGTSLSSHHDIIAREASLLWIDTFGPVPKSEYPEALRRLLSPTGHGEDFNLLEGIEETPVKEQTYIIPTDASPSIPTPSKNLSPPSERPSFHEVEKEVPGQQLVADHESVYSAAAINPRSTPEPRPLPVGMGSKTTPPVRLRHNDSQIEFAAIDSSPYDLESLESQFMTEYQKEVKERQKQEAAALFPDLRSSPRFKPRGMAQELPKLYLSSQKISHQIMEDITSSPSLPPADSDVNDYISSSPTPRSQRVAPRGHFPLRDPSSSPQIFKAGLSIDMVDSDPDQEKLNSKVPPLSTEQQAQVEAFDDDAEMSMSVDSTSEDEDQNELPSIEGVNDEIEMPDIRSSSDGEDNEAELPSPSLPQPVPLPSRLISHIPAAEPIHRSTSDDNIFSDLDQFVDARSNQNCSSPEPAEKLHFLTNVSEVAENILDLTVEKLQVGIQISDSAEASKGVGAVTVVEEEVLELALDSSSDARKVAEVAEKSSHFPEQSLEAATEDLGISAETIEDTNSGQQDEASIILVPSFTTPENPPSSPHQSEILLNQLDGTTVSEPQTQNSPKPNPGRAISPDPDKQISAQLATEMEKAMSQASGNSEGMIPETPDPTNRNKRKRATTGSQTMPKKRRSPEVRVVVPKREALPVKDDEEIFDCIVVATRAGETPKTTPTPSQQSQQRKSASRLVKFSSSQASNATQSTQSQGHADSKKKTRGPARSLAEFSSPVKDTPAPTRKRRRQSTQEDEADGPSQPLTPSLRTKKRTRLSKASQRPETANPTAATGSSTVPIARSRGASLRWVSDNERGMLSPERMVSPDETEPVKVLPNGSSQAKDEADLDVLPSETGNGQEITNQTSNHEEDPVNESPVSANTIIERLKQVLNDARNVVLGSRERKAAVKTWMALGQELQKEDEGDSQEE